VEWWWWVTMTMHMCGSGLGERAFADHECEALGEQYLRGRRRQLVHEERELAQVRPEHLVRVRERVIRACAANPDQFD
jgi:hypothetical protein